LVSKIPFLGKIALLLSKVSYLSIIIFSCGVMVAPLILVQKIVVRVHAGKLFKIPPQFYDAPGSLSAHF
jgi:hypothetical protein